jgi:pimeloyl-ACP methyl ester carboxylesterase
VTVANRTFTMEGIAACGEDSSRNAILQAGKPLAVLVHGCKGSERDFGRLAEVLALHDRQTVCFRYDDRASVRRTADNLRSALTRLVRELSPSEVLVLGHSQGGLVARNALTSRLDTPLESARYHLVTVSSPFAGIRAARDCGSIPFHLGSLGMTMAVCRAVSGAKWNEIHARSSLVRRPALLAPAVREHLTIVTDERDTCRRFAPDGQTCIEDDYVFSVAEQHNARLLRDQRVYQSDVAAGHSEIVGLRGDSPRKLLDALQQRGLLRATHPDEEHAVQRLTAKMSW